MWDLLRLFCGCVVTSVVASGDHTSLVVASHLLGFAASEAKMMSYLHTLALLPSVKRQLLCVSERLKLVKHKA